MIQTELERLRGRVLELERENAELHAIVSRLEEEVEAEGERADVAASELFDARRRSMDLETRQMETVAHWESRQ